MIMTNYSKRMQEQCDKVMKVRKDVWQNQNMLRKDVGENQITFRKDGNMLRKNGNMLRKDVWQN
jgi:hypothetical protein